jgi:hypothetical protein
MFTKSHSARVAVAIKSNPKTAKRVANLPYQKALRIRSVDTLLLRALGLRVRQPKPLTPSQMFSFIIKVLSFKKH